jgi:hypothetical protein
MTVNNIKIPAKHYVGMTKRQVEKIPLGFITPWGEDAAAKKRMATVDTWARQTRNTLLESMIIDNVPLNGFKMTTDIRSSSYGGVDKWRIEDPRGFELEITSHNLAQLLTVGMIDRGEIMDTCVWAREGQQNVLLSTNTDEYKSAVKNTEVAAMTADWKNVKIGNTILLQNNVTGVWLGRMFGMSYYESHRADGEKTNLLTVSDKSMHVIYIKEEDKNYKHKLLLISSPKLAAITDTATMSETESEVLVNQLINDSTCRIESTGYRSFIALTIGSPKIGETATLSLKPVSVSGVGVLEKLTDYTGKYNVYMKTDNTLKKLRSAKSYRTNKVGFTCYSYSMDAFKEHKLIPVGSMKSNGNGYWGRSEVWTQHSHEYDFRETDEFFAAVVTINTKAGSTIEAYVR